MKLAALTAVALAAALSLAACGKGGDAAKPGEPPSGERIAPIAPPAGKSWTETVTVTPEGGYRMGNPAAPVQLVEFGALSCSHCAEFAQKGFPELRDDYVASGRVSFELRLFMLNPFDIPAAMLVTCGAPEAVIPLSDQFWAWQPNMFTNLQQAGEAQLQAASALPDNQRYAAIARLAGMDAFFASRGIAADQGAACLADAANATRLAEATKQASEKYEVTGTPWFYLNGANLGSMGWEQLEPLLQKAGAR